MTPVIVTSALPPACAIIKKPEISLSSHLENHYGKLLL